MYTMDIEQLPQLSGSQLEEVNALNQEIEKSKASLLKLQNELQQNCEQITYTATQISTLEELSHQLAQNQAKIQELELTINQNQQSLIQNQHCEQQLKEFREKYDELAQTETQVYSQIDDLQTQIMQYQNKIIEMNVIKAQLASYKKNEGDDTTANEEFVQKLQDEVKQCNEQLQSSIDAMNKEIAADEVKYMDLMQENEKLQNELKALQNSIKRHQDFEAEQRRKWMNETARAMSNAVVNAGWNVTKGAAGVGWGATKWTAGVGWGLTKWTAGSVLSLTVNGATLGANTFKALYGGRKNVFNEIAKITPKNLITTINPATDLFINNKKIRVFFEHYPKYFVRYVCHGSRLKAIKITDLVEPPDEIVQELAVLEALKKAKIFPTTKRDENKCILLERQGNKNVLKYVVNIANVNKTALETIENYQLFNKQFPFTWYMHSAATKQSYT